MDAPGKLESIQEARDASLVLSKLQGVQAGGILQILKSDWFREQAVFYDLPANPDGILGSFKQTNILSLCPYSLMINQISKDIYIHLNSRELKARHVNRRSTTQCNATSRFRYTVLFGINVQDTIKYLSTIWHVWNCCRKCYWRYIAFYKDKEEILQTYPRKVFYMVLYG